MDGDEGCVEVGYRVVSWGDEGCKVGFKGFDMRRQNKSRGAEGLRRYLSCIREVCSFSVSTPLSFKG